MYGVKRRAFLAGLASVGACSALPPSLRSPSASPVDKLIQIDALGLAELIEAKEVSAADLVDLAFQRIQRLDKQLNAMTTLAPTRARARVEQGSSGAMFAGVPIAFKDLIDVAGVRRTNGSRMMLNSTPPTQSVDYVRAVETAGLTIIGMTNTPEFASIALTDNAVFGATRNPWALEYSAGGSSGGSAAAVAAGYVPIAHGTDGGGSNRIPASCCGVFGMKASRYRQLSGEANGQHMFLRTHQCLSRSVRDSAALLAHTENKSNSASYAPLGFVQTPNKRRLRLALSYENCLGQKPETAVHTAIEDTAKLCESLGHHVEEISNPIDGEPYFRAIEGIMLAGMPKLLAAVEAQTGRPAEETNLLTSATIAMGRYAEQLPNDAQKKGLQYFERLSESMADFFNQYDVWLSPVIPIETPKIGYISPSMPFEIAMPRNRELLSHTALANGLGAPAMSVPLFHSSKSGLPIGSHFMAAPGEDRTLYELAYELEAALPWTARWAPYSAAFK